LPEMQNWAWEAENRKMSKNSFHTSYERFV
jgi:hypothetical protein